MRLMLFRRCIILLKAYHTIKLAEPVRSFRANQILNSFKNFVNTGESMLSVGDGDGYVSNKIQEKTGVIIKGLDILFFEKYREKSIPLILYDGEEIPFPDESFDITAGIFLLHHCENFHLTLREMIRVSKKKLLIVEDVFNNRIEQLFLRFFDFIENRTFSSKMPIPYNFHSLIQWKEIFQQYNLKLVCSIQFHSLPLPVRNQSFCLLKKSN